MRRASSYYEDLVALERTLEKAGQRPVSIKEVDARLEDEDMLQMVDAGIIPATVSKLPVAEFWAQLYDGWSCSLDVPLRSDGEIAWALRKDTPQIKKVIDEFRREAPRRHALWQRLAQRYLGSVKRLTNPMSARPSSRSIAPWRSTFRTYSDQYGSDWVLAVAQGYQESRARPIEAQ